MWKRPCVAVRGSNCGIALKDGLFSVQYHPERLGPRDSHYLFDRFVALMRDKRWRDRRRDAHKSVAT